MKNKEAQASLSSIVVLVLAIAVVIVGLRGFEQIEPGHEGVVYNLDVGVKETPLYPGFNWLNPLTDNVVTEMNIQIQKKEVEAHAATKDLQPITAIIALNYHPAKGKTPWIYQTIGEGYADTVITPALQDTFKATTAKFAVNQIIDSREIVGLQAEELMRKEMLKYNIVVDKLNIVNVVLDEKYQAAIVEKQTAEQKVLTEKNNLERIKIEKEQVITQAQGAAESMRIKAEALSKNQQLVAWEAIQRWNGVMPQYYMPGQDGNLLFNIPAPK